MKSGVLCGPVRATRRALAVLPALAVLLAAPVAAEPTPADPDRFLTFLNSVSPEHREDATTAAAYYEAIDPLGQRTTLSDWLTLNGFDSGADAEAIYVNDVDLGFGRHMFVKTVGARVASYVKNHSDDTPLGDPVDGPAEEKIANAHAGTNLIATVVMEYVSPPSDPVFGPQRTIFLAYDANGDRVLAADLDGRGAKFIPGACNVCHGGAPRPLLADGSYPDEGDTGAGFLPWDLDSFQYSSSLFDGVAKYTRAAQEAAFKTLNLSLLQTSPAPVVQDLIEGWYGGFGAPSPTFHGAYVPSGWSGHFLTYLDKFAPNCRACHLMRNPAVDFSTYTKFSDLGARAQHFVFDRGVMPMARRTYERFWPAYSDTDAGFLDLFGVVATTRRPGSGVPLAFAGVDGPMHVGTPRTLDASASSYATSYGWTVVSAPAGSSASLVDPASVAPEFTPDLPGSYEFELTATNASGSATARVKALATSGVLRHFFTKTGVDFAADVLPVIDANCISCHSAPGNGSGAPPFDFPQVSTREETIYRSLSLRANAMDPAQSLLLLKPTGAVAHGGGSVLTNPGAAYDTLRDWVAQGVRRAVDADDDGLDDRLESDTLTSVAHPDSDGDGYQDGVEVVHGSDPGDGSSVPPSPQRLSLDRSGWGFNATSGGGAPTLTADGRLLAFQSNASNLDVGVSGSSALVKDALTGRSRAVDVDLNGLGASGEQPVISSDGGVVAFRSASSGLISSDFNAVRDVFVTDLATGVTTRVSTDSAGGEADGPSGSSFKGVALSGDGRFVAFQSDATNLVAGDTNFLGDVFVKDRQTGVTLRASTDSAGAQGNVSESYRPSISADGRYVAFVSLTSDLVAGDTNGAIDVFVKDTSTGALTRASTDSAGAQSDGHAFNARVSADGRFVVFDSAATNLVAGDGNGSVDVFLKDLVTGTTTRVSVDAAGTEADGGSSDPSISDDARFVAFSSGATNLVAGESDGNGFFDVFVKDLTSGATARVSRTPAGLDANGDSSAAVISGDGHTIVFTTAATNLGGGVDDNFSSDVYRAVNPLSPADSDGDGLDDAAELLLGTNPNLADSDSDGLTDLEEVFRNFDASDIAVGIDTDPNDPDSDGDGFLDGDEVAAGTDPLDAASFPGPGPSVPALPLGAALVCGLGLALAARTRLAPVG